VSSTFRPSATVHLAEPPRWRSGLPGLAACALLLGEYLLTSYAFDIRPLAERSDWLAVLGSAGSVGPLVLAVATATLLLGGRPLLEDLRCMLEAAANVDRRSLSGRLVFVALHLVSFAVFFSLNRLFLDALAVNAPHAALLAGAWLGCALAAFLALVHAVVPLPALLPAARGVMRALMVGTALGTAAWAGGLWTLHFWDPLGAVTLHGVAAVLRLAGDELYVDAATATLGFEGFRVEIAPVCSGYEGIGLLTILTGAYLWTFRSTLRFPSVLAILPIGIALVWLANVVRIAALMLMGARWSADAALGSFHSKAGWVLFCGIALGLVAVTQRTPFFWRAGRIEVASTNPTAAYLTPLLALVAVHLVTDLFSPSLPLLYPLGVVAGAAALWWHRGHYPWLFRPVWSLEAFGIGLAAFAVWIALAPAEDPMATDAWRRELGALAVPVAALWIAFRALGSSILVPLVEELAFRGYLLRRLVARDFTSVPFARFGWLSFLGSSAAFGLLHERWVAGIAVGMLFSLAQYRRGRLGDAVLAHAVTNLLITLYAIGWRQWALWV
jgi:exosortase E/protease (VPEID-CTERM system)